MVFQWDLIDGPNFMVHLVPKESTNRLSGESPLQGAARLLEVKGFRFRGIQADLSLIELSLLEGHE